MKFAGTDLAYLKADYDVCIAGSGPAGFTAALELKASGLTVCILESGGEVATPMVDDLMVVESDGLRIREDSRERVLGGTSLTWSGFIAPLDAIDFEPRPGIHEGWPVSRSEIQSYIDNFGHRYMIPPADAFEYNPETIDESRRIPTLPSLGFKVFRTQTPPFRYGKRFRHTFLPENFDVFLGATVVKLAWHRESGREVVDAAVVADGSGQLHEVRAKTFVLAASAIESVRILLNSEGLGNAHDQVGRYFMNHPKGNVGKVTFSRALAQSHELFERKYHNFNGYVGLRLKERLQRDEGDLNSYVRLEITRDEGEFPKAKELSKAFRSTLKSIGRGDFRCASSSGISMVRRADGLGQIIVRGAKRMRNRNAGLVKTARLRCFVEMEPAPDHRITLTDRRDRFGIPLPKVSHAISDLALRSVERLISKIEREFAQANFGTVYRAQGALEDILGVDSSHHLGGARMGEDPKSSVVDPSLRVHSSDNLFIAGGAVFPTGGNANPTLTIVGLSIRLANFIKGWKGHRVTPAARPQGAGVLIVGAGRRVSEDIVPAVESLAPGAHIKGIYATKRNVVFGPTATHEVFPLRELSEETIASSRLVYVAVPPEKLQSVLAKFLDYSCEHLSLVVETPAVDAATVDGAYAHFGNVIVAEDSAYLPWLDLLTGQGRVVRADFDRSGYRYHATAIARALASDSNNKRPRIASMRGRKDDIEVRFDGGLAVRIRGPRDYDNGRMSFQTLSGRSVSSHPGEGHTQIRPLISGNLCVGFELDGDVVHLSETESRLIGRFTDKDTIVSRMLDIKRAALYRLLQQVLADQPGYTLAEGLEDASVRW
ncbi:FAD dependent oxidoreductase (plasmid) [Sinorhizobium fredii HH103]|uniref:FAD dependent oxidoreductase n=1 Tax=Sinorhizobium fredii (strain HH103) TaxID=1117943 RepID=G9AIA0_SINF1|nr:GMC family oxidoreductase [Sinorhizobium fredii]CCF00782.1 FAD dependent oxidoreductase [Sinorhizobium fredii HH103]